MKILRVFSVVIAMLINADAVAKGVGMVMDVQGTATIISGGNPRQLEITNTLLQDTNVDIEPGGEISFVFYPTREMITARGPTVLSIGEKTVSLVKGSKLQVAKLPEEKTQIALGYHQTASLAMSMRGLPKGSGACRQLFPVDGETVLVPNVEFNWNVLCRRVKFELYEGQELLYEEKFDDDRLRLPATTMLQPGRRYRWNISAVDGANSVPVTAEFYVASAEELENLKRLKPEGASPTSEWTLYGLALAQAGAISEARRVWESISKDRPQSATARKLAK